MNILEAVEHPDVFKPLFRNPEDWRAWFSFLRVLFGLETTADDLALFKECTERSIPAKCGYTECWLICGRRSGKSYTMALIAVFLAAFHDYRPYLAYGERGTLMIIAADRKQARNVLRYIRGMLDLPVFKPLVERETADSFDLNNRVTIEVGTANYKTIRGYTTVAALCDEIAYWSGEDSAQPDEEILNALRPSMVTIPNAMLICASNPHGKFGALWKAYQRHYGKEDSRVLVWRATTRTMHPSITQAFVDRAVAEDPNKARSEYYAEFRQDISQFIDREVVESLVLAGRYEEPPIVGVEYHAFCDPSGGAADSFTLAIAYAKQSPDNNDESIGVLACLREFHAPFSPDSVVAEIAKILSLYDIGSVIGDRYAGEWPPDRFAIHSIRYTTSELTKNEIYQNALPLLMQGRVELLDDKRMIGQICALERRTARGGRDSIDHPQGQHDDCANAALGALLLAAGKVSSGRVWEILGSG